MRGVYGDAFLSLRGSKARSDQGFDRKKAVEHCSVAPWRRPRCRSRDVHAPGLSGSTFAAPILSAASRHMGPDAAVIEAFRPGWADRSPGFLKCGVACVWTATASLAWSIARASSQARLAASYETAMVSARTPFLIGAVPRQCTVADGFHDHNALRRPSVPHF